jgi:hypothetical protein
MGVAGGDHGRTGGDDRLGGKRRPVTGLGNRIPARGSERAAPHESASSEPEAAPRAVHLERLERVARAGRGEPARRRAALGRSLVPDHGALQPAVHRSSGRLGAAGGVGGWSLEFVPSPGGLGPERVFARAARGRDVELASASTAELSSSHDDPPAPVRTPTRYQPGGSAPVDADADSRTRNCRRNRLRTTAGPTARPMANATRGGDADGSGRNVHHSTPARVRRPSCDNRAKTPRSRMRQIKRTACAGPWPGAT